MISNRKSQLSSVIPYSTEALEFLVLPLLYFEIFSHPLSREELLQFSHNTISTDWLDEQLKALIEGQYLYEIEGYYLTQDQPEWVAKRQIKEARAHTYLRRAHWAVKLMRHFPFVRGIFISGSLSKGVIDHDGDIDYFIVTQPERLWVSRTLLVAFKKFFLFNSHKYFCVNYFVDDQHLNIEEQNRFTATEVVTILPYYNPELYAAFRAANSWCKTYYPQFPLRSTVQTLAYRNSWIQRLSEWLLGGSLGEKFDYWCMHRSIRFWEQKFADFSPDKFAVALKSRRYVSKHHPQDFQRKVRQAYTENIQRYEQTHKLKLPQRPFTWCKANSHEQGTPE